MIINRKQRWLNVETSKHLGRHTSDDVSWSRRLYTRAFCRRITTDWDDDSTSAYNSTHTHIDFIHTYLSYLPQTVIQETLLTTQWNYWLCVLYNTPFNSMLEIVICQINSVTQYVSLENRNVQLGDRRYIVNVITFSYNENFNKVLCTEYILIRYTLVCCHSFVC